MRRDYFAVDVANVETGGMPTLHIQFEGPSDQFTERFTDRGDEPLSGEEFDVAYRLQGAIDAAETQGVVAVSNRITGEYILELNAPAETIFDFVSAAREYGNQTGEEDRYRFVLSVEGDRRLVAEKSTFLVYDVEGELRRERSLIPSGVEL